MLHDNISVREIVDKECAHEFLMEATKLASSEELEITSALLEKKSRMFQQILGQEALAELDEAKLKSLMRSIFFLRRKFGPFLKKNDIDGIRENIGRLLYGEEPLGERFERFTGAMEGLKGPLAIALASEILHYTQPERYWLWSSWIWDPKTTGGALPLVLQKEADLAGDGIGETYEKVGHATAMVNAVGHEEGFSNIGRGLFGTNVFLACVYTVFMYTAFKMRLSEEFNRILPELPEFTRRLLGVQNLNREDGDV